MLTDFLQTCVDGLMLGASYALLALGLALSCRAAGRFNFAYGGTVTLGAGAGTLMFVEYFDSVPYVLAATLVAAALASLYAERASIWAVRRRGALAAAVAGLAVWLQFEAIVGLALPGEGYPFLRPTAEPPLALGPVLLRLEDLIAVAAVAPVVVLLPLPLYFTRFGLRLRAVMDNRRAAELAGINAARMTLWAFVVAGALGGLAGYMMMSTSVRFTPWFGFWALLKSLVAMLVGGGSLPGAVLGGLLLGLVEAQGVWYLGPAYRDYAAVALLIVILLLRPRGILGRGARWAVQEP